MSQQTATKKGTPAPNPLALDVAVSETKRYAASIVANPKACPMFPVLTSHGGALETLCYLHGYLAGIADFAGATPTRDVMNSMVRDALSDDNVRDIVLKMTPSLDECINPPQDY